MRGSLGLGIDFRLTNSVGGWSLGSIAAPVGFTYPAELPSVNISETSTGGVFSVGDFDITSGMPTGKAYYVSTTGSDANDGLTVGAPLASLLTACRKIDVDVVYAEAGVYARNKSFQGMASVIRPLSIIATGGKVVSTAYDVLSWVADATYTNVSKSARSAVYDVFDGGSLSADGDAEKLTLVASSLVVSTTPGSYYTDGIDVWILPTDERLLGSADATMWPMISVENIVTTDLDLYLEGIEFRGGIRSASFNSTISYINVRAKDCEFKYSKEASAGGMRVIGSVATVMQDCVASSNPLDGFNYHANGADIPAALEINCVGRNNGTVGDTTDNGSTMHDAGTIVRVNGDYHDNYGPNIVDVNSSLSWNLGVHAHDSLAVTNDTDFYVDGNMWLDKCSINGSTSSVGFNAAIGVINYTNMGTISGLGTLTPYDRTYE